VQFIEFQIKSSQIKSNSLFNMAAIKAGLEHAMFSRGVSYPSLT